MARKICVMMKKMYVPCEIVREIFLYLPCKSLSKFRSISKQYKSHIDDLQFMEEHRKRNMKASHLLIWDDFNPTNLHIFKMGMDSYSHIKTIPTYTYISALPSSYGMVCLQRWNCKKIALLNPLSGEIISLPDLHDYEYKHSNRKYLGFGFDPKSRRYKIVQFVFDVQLQTMLRFHILTATRNGSSWRTVDMSSKILGCYLWGDPLCVDGALYFLTAGINFKVYRDVHVLDLGTEEMKIIQPPAKWNINRDKGRLALLEGKICCYNMTSPANVQSTMDIWSLDYDSNNNVNWNLRYNFEIYGLNSKMSPVLPSIFYDSKRILFRDGFTKGFYCYDTKEKRMKRYPLVEEFEGVACWFRVSAVLSETFIVPLD